VTAETERRVMFEQTHGAIEIQYEAEPVRLYRVRDLSAGIEGGVPTWREVPSVTTVLDVLNKPALPWWGMKIGVQGVLELFGVEIIVGADGRLLVAGDGQFEYATVENIVQKLTKHRKTVNHVRDDAGQRGNSVHAALEQWVADRTIPEPSFYPPEEEGYVRALRSFLTDLGEVKTAESEVMVGSAAYGYAGRYDVEAVLHNANLVTKKASPSWDPTPGATNHHSAKAEERTTFDGRTLLDLKTSKGIYLSHYLQMEAYEGARQECGMPPTKQRLVVQVGADGTYMVGSSPCDLGDFVAVLGTYNALGRYS